MDGSTISTTTGITNRTYSSASSGSTVQPSTDGSNISTILGITNGTYSPGSSGSTIQTSKDGSIISTTLGITNGTYSPASSGSTVQTSTDGSNILTTPLSTNGTYSPATSDLIIQISNASNMSPTQEDATVTSTMTITSKVTMSAVSQTTKKLTNQTDMLTSIGHVAEVTVHPTSRPSSSVLDEPSRIAIGSIIAGLGVFGIASLVVYRLVCIGKKIIPAAAR